MWSRQVLKEKAKERIKVNYWKMVLVGLILTLFTGNIGSTSAGSEDETRYEQSYETEYDEAMDIDAFFTNRFEAVVGTLAVGVIVTAGVIIIVLSIFVLNPLRVGGMRFFYRNIRQKAELKELGYAFDNGYGNHVKTMFLMSLYTFLWSLLLVIPGIIKSYEYRMIPYLLAEHPDMSCEEAFATSKRMMYGNKLNAFWFDLSFIGWNILGALTFGIVNVFYVNPYYQQACAMLYDAIKFDDNSRMAGTQDPTGF